MHLELLLPAELEARLHNEARRQGLSPDKLTINLLDQHLPAPDRRAALIGLLQEWKSEDDAMTDAEAGANADVLRAIDQDRLSDRKLFTEYVKENAP